MTRLRKIHEQRYGQKSSLPIGTQSVVTDVRQIVFDLIIIVEQETALPEASHLVIEGECGLVIMHDRPQKEVTPRFERHRDALQDRLGGCC